MMMASGRLVRRRLAVMTAVMGAAYAACTRLGLAEDAPREEPVETAVPISTAPAETPVPPTPIPEPTPQPTPIPSLAIYYDPSYVMAGYSYETTRKARWVADSLAGEPIPRIELISPRPLEEPEVAAVHDPVYVQAVRTGQPRTLAQSQGFVWDPKLLPAVLASNGGAVEAALRVLRSAGRTAGSLSSGLHHAHRTYGLGNCTFNGLALAARAVLGAGAKNVLILDLDAHCGGGTNELVGGDARVWHVDVAVHPFDKYTPAPRQTLDVIQAARSYLPTIEKRLDELPDRAPAFDLCLYNAGMDPHERCPVGGLAGVTREVLEARERMVFQWARERGLPVAFVLAGGYVGSGLDQGGLVNLHRLTLDAASAWL
jgi:acetoin utilization deacetylase AcuC-like enzyme